MMIIITGSCLLAGITFSMLKLIGYYEQVSWIGLSIFVATCILYVLISIVFIRNGFTEVDGEKVLRPEMLLNAKRFVTIRNRSIAGVKDIICTGNYTPFD